jgi:hypothetical protein
MNRQLVRYCKSRLLPKVISDYKDAVKHSESFSEVKVTSIARLCYNANGVLSLYTDVTEQDAVGSLTVRFADVWSLSTGCPLPKASFFPKNVNYKKKLKNFAIKEVKRLTDNELGVYFDHARKNCSRHFSTEHFYITSEGLVIFYPMYSIASRMEAIPAFTLRWSEDGPCEPHCLL